MNYLGSDIGRQVLENNRRFLTLHLSLRAFIIIAKLSVRQECVSEIILLPYPWSIIRQAERRQGAR